MAAWLRGSVEPTGLLQAVGVRIELEVIRSVVTMVFTATGSSYGPATQCGSGLRVEDSRQWHTAEVTC